MYFRTEAAVRRIKEQFMKRAKSEKSKKACAVCGGSY